MRKKLAYLTLILGVLGVFAGSYTGSTGYRSGVKTADIVPWPPHAQ
jgi:hypothetical protein